MTLPSIYIFEMLVYVKTNFTKFTLKKDIHTYNTRKKCDIYIKHNVIKLTQNYVFFKGTHLYNSLPESIRCLNVNKFKLEVKKIILQGSYYSVEDFLNRN